MTDKPDVSILLCTYNRADMLPECLQSLLDQKTNGEFTFEVVVIDNNSSDNTEDVVVQMQQTSPVPLRYVFEPKAGQVHARHRGFDEAKGDWIANFDDDEVAEPEWALELLRLARAKNIRSVGGLLLLRLPPDCDRDLHPRVRRVLGESVLWPEPRAYTRRQGPGSGTQLIHKSVLEEVGRYDISQSLRGYDTDLYRRMREAGIESWFAPKSVAYHVTPPNRLTYEYLRETCFHDGCTFCRRDVEHFGKLKSAAVVILRLSNAGVRHLPAFAAAKLTGKKETALAHSLMLVRAEGYFRCFLDKLAPGFFKQKEAREKYRWPANSSPPEAAND